MATQLKPEQRDARHILCQVSSLDLPRPPEQRDARHILCQVRVRVSPSPSPSPNPNPNPSILWQVMKQVVVWKKLNTEPDALMRFKQLNRMPL